MMRELRDDNLKLTGFLRTAEDPTDSPERDNPLLRYEVLHQEQDILTSAVIGLTVGCARCHDHKFDPISQRDYYSLMATLTPAYNPVKWTPVLERTLADIPPAKRERHHKPRGGCADGARKQIFGKAHGMNIGFDVPVEGYAAAPPGTMTPTRRSGR